MYEGLFQSTLPARGATHQFFASLSSIFYFNPRSPHGERQSQSRAVRYTSNFNPRSPHGERPKSSLSEFTTWAFQSTLPARGATDLLATSVESLAIFQSTLPARGATYFTVRVRQMSKYHFNPRSPHGERLTDFSYMGIADSISIHAPRTGSDYLQSG